MAVPGQHVHVADVGHVEVVHRVHGAAVGAAHVHVHVHGVGERGVDGRAHALVGVHGRHGAQRTHPAQPAVHRHPHSVHGRLVVHLQVVLRLHQRRRVDRGPLARDPVLHQHGDGDSARGRKRVDVRQPFLLAGPLQLVAVVLEPDLHLHGGQPDDGGQVLPLGSGQVALLPEASLQLVCLRFGEEDPPLSLLVGLAVGAASLRVLALLALAVVVGLLLDAVAGLVGHVRLAAAFHTRGVAVLARATH